jgi:hypothetical protein
MPLPDVRVQRGVSGGGKWWLRSFNRVAGYHLIRDGHIEGWESGSYRYWKHIMESNRAQQNFGTAQTACPDA